MAEAKKRRGRPRADVPDDTVVTTSIQIDGATRRLIERECELWGRSTSQVIMMALTTYYASSPRRTAQRIYGNRAGRIAHLIGSTLKLFDTTHNDMNVKVKVTQQEANELRLAFEDTMHMLEITDE